MREKKKYTVSAELFGFMGLAIVALGSALMVAAQLGVETVVVPPYLLFLGAKGHLPWLTFGMVSWTYEILLLLLLVILTRRVCLNFLLSLGTGFLSAAMMDGWSALIRWIGATGWFVRVAQLGAGICLCALGISMIFFCYLASPPYELVVQEIATHFHWKTSVVKTCYDIISCMIGLILSFSFFGMWKLRGLQIGTLLCAVSVGPLIGLISRWIRARFIFRDALPLRELLNR